MDLQLTITLSDRLFCLLEDKLPNLGRRMENTITRAAKAQLREEVKVEITPVNSSFADTFNPDEVDEKPKVKSIEVVRPAKKAEPESPAKEAPEAPAAAVESSAESASPGQPQTVSLEDVRAAMERARRKFEGDDYQTKPDTEEYRKYHRQLTRTFKELATLLGAPDSRPGSLPPEFRAKFIEALGELEINEKGDIACKAPF